MPAKKSKQKRPRRTQKSREIIAFRLVIFSCILVFALSLVQTITQSFLHDAQVLGEKILLAHNDINGEDEEAGNELEENRKEINGHPQDDTKVICVGKEKRKFKTTYKECKRIDEELNQPVVFEIIETP